MEENTGAKLVCVSEESMEGFIELLYRTDYEPCMWLFETLFKKQSKDAPQILKTIQQNEEKPKKSIKISAKDARKQWREETLEKLTALQNKNQLLLKPHATSRKRNLKYDHLLSTFEATMRRKSNEYPKLNRP